MSLFSKTYNTLFSHSSPSIYTQHFLTSPFKPLNTNILTQVFFLTDHNIIRMAPKGDNVVVSNIKLERIFSMKGGKGEASYANNSQAQVGPILIIEALNH